MIINQGLQSRMVKLVTSNKKMLECMTPPLYGIYRCVQPQRVCFSAVLAINRVSVLADFGHLGHKKGIVLPSSLDMGMFLRSHLFLIIETKLNKS